MLCEYCREYFDGPKVPEDHTPCPHAITDLNMNGLPANGEGEHLGDPDYLRPDQKKYLAKLKYSMGGIQKTLIKYRELPGSFRVVVTMDDIRDMNGELVYLRTLLSTIEKSNENG